MLDTPGILPPEIHDIEVCSKLALTGVVILFILFLGVNENYNVSPIAILAQWLRMHNCDLLTCSYSIMFVTFKIIVLLKFSADTQCRFLCLLNAGAIRDSFVGEKKLAEYFLAILNSSDEYKKWAKFSTYENDKSNLQHNVEHSAGSELEKKQKRQYPSDHTQV